MNKIDKKLLDLLKKKRKENYDNPNSIALKYDRFLEEHGVYRSFNQAIFEKSIKGRLDLCEGILSIYNEATLDNEKISILWDLKTIGYNKDKLVELALSEFDSDNISINLWSFADLLYSIKNFNYMSNYLKIVKNKTYGTARQMLVLLIGKSKISEIVPDLIALLDDQDVQGHVISALSNFPCDEVTEIMKKYSKHNTTWIRNEAKKYLSKHC